MLVPPLKLDGYPRNTNMVGLHIEALSWCTVLAVGGRQVLSLAALGSQLLWIRSWTWNQRDETGISTKTTYGWEHVGERARANESLRRCLTGYRGPLKRKSLMPAHRTTSLTWLSHVHPDPEWTQVPAPLRGCCRPRYFDNLVQTHDVSRFSPTNVPLSDRGMVKLSSRNMNMVGIFWRSVGYSGDYVWETRTSRLRNPSTNYRLNSLTIQPVTTATMVTDSSKGQGVL